MRVQSALLIAISGGQMVSVGQFFGVMSSIHFEFEPLSTVISAFNVVNFDLDIFGFQCISFGDPLLTFLSKILIATAAVFFLAVIHAAHVLLKHNGAFRTRMPSLINAVGTTTFAFFITVVIAAVGPLRARLLLKRNPP